MKYGSVTPMFCTQVWNHFDAEWAAGSHHGGGRYQPADANRERRRQVTCFEMYGTVYCDHEIIHLIHSCSCRDTIRQCCVCTVFRATVTAVPPLTRTYINRFTVAPSHCPSIPFQRPSADYLPYRYSPILIILVTF
jgi:hypothetical protein